MDDEIPYTQMVDTALRSVVYEAIKAVVDRGGLPGDHHFSITFLTQMAGVRMPSHLLEKYPRELTIILQHDFHGLALTEDAFRVTLRFDDRAARLYIPIAAITTFADPSRNFAISFNAHAMLASDEADGEDERSGDEADTLKGRPPAVSSVVSFNDFRKPTDRR